MEKVIKKIKSEKIYTFDKEVNSSGKIFKNYPIKFEYCKVERLISCIQNFENVNPGQFE